MADTILVRVCCNLPGVQFGDIVSVDPTNPYIAERIEKRLLDPVAPVAASPERADEQPGENTEAASDGP